MLGSLGSRKRRAGTNGVLGSLGATPTQWTVDARVKALQVALNAQMAAVGCTTKLTTDGLIGPGTCGALAWSKATGSPPSAYLTAATDLDAGCRAFTPKAPACPAPTAAVVPSSGGTVATVTATPGATYGLPFVPGVKNATAAKWQYMLNSELAARGLPTVPEDGIFSLATCAGFGAFGRSYNADPNSPTPDDTFAGIVVQYQKGIVAACAALAQPAAAPSTSVTVATAPPVAAPAANAGDLMRQQQTMLNAWLTSVGYQPIPVSGVWDGPTCGAGQLMAKTLPDTDPAKIALAGVLAKIKPLLGMPCGVSVTAVPPSKPSAAAPSSAQIAQMQALINAEVLVPGGYRLIPQDGTLGPATCGAASDTASAASIGRIQISTTLQALLDHAGLLPGCVPFKPWQFPQMAAPSVAARSSALPPLNRDGECVINFGQRYGEIGILQQQLNDTLTANGYQPIPVTNVWDAATCGAMFALGGRFSPRASGACPNAYSVPLTCPAVDAPNKIAVTPVPARPVPTPVVRPWVAPPKIKAWTPPVRPAAPPVKRASMALPLGIAAIVGVAAIVLAKKKGLIMAGKAASRAKA
jgi:hypothetical protein